MLRAVRAVSQELQKSSAPVPYTLEQITRAVIGLTVIDEVVFVEYQAEPTNPIWGSFQKWGRRPSVYASLDTLVEIRYASHLTEAWRRFVVCKELCHALDSSEGVHSVSNRSVETIIAGFSLLSSNKSLKDGFGQPMQAELIAEMVASEFLCPIAVRRKEINGVKLTTEAKIELAARFKIPQYYADWVFGADYLDMVEAILENGE